MGIKVDSLAFSYGRREVLRDVSFEASEGEFTSLLGPNGVGKSTLFRCMLGLDKSYRGTILLGGRDIRSLRSREIAKLVAYIPQTQSMVFNYSVIDTVLFGTSGSLSAAGVPGKKEYGRAERAMEEIGISHLADRFCREISGGELQLVMIARALAQSSPILMLDEPTANLDFGNQLRVLTKLRELANKGYTIIQSTHNPDQGNMFSDRVIAMSNGTIVADGRPEKLITPELMQTLYGVAVKVESLCGDRVRVCVPESIAAV